MPPRFCVGIPPSIAADIQSGFDPTLALNSFSLYGSLFFVAITHVFRLVVCTERANNNNKRLVSSTKEESEKSMYAGMEVSE